MSDHTSAVKTRPPSVRAGRGAAGATGRAGDQGGPAIESVDDRMIALMRLILALSALLIIYIDPSEPDRLVAVTYGALVAYSLYSAVVYYLTARRAPPLPNRAAHWIDVGWFLVLVALSSGTSSVFFFFFFFAILVASFRRGFRAGFGVTLCSALLFTVVGYLTAPLEPEFELNRFLLRPVYLLVLGYMMAYWGGREIRLKRRLSLLKEIAKLSNPRFGVTEAVGSMLHKLQTFYDADACSLVLTDPPSEEPRLYSLERGGPAESVRAEPLPAALARLLLSLAEDVAVVHDGRAALRLSDGGGGDYAFDLKERRERTAEWRAAGASLASKLGAESLVSVPLRYRGRAAGRLYVAARRGTFAASDVDFLTQVGEQIMPIVHNIRLLARLSSSAAEQERQRLARDIHDSVIQPYVGLQYKLAAIRNKLAEGGDVAGDIERLFQVTANEVSGLRGFVRRLRDAGPAGDDFLEAVRRFAALFAEDYGLDVRVESEGDVNVDPRLAAELIQFVHEGLRNVRKHTEASRCEIRLARTGGLLRLSIENDGGGDGGPACEPFFPASITERAEDLGGSVRVECKEGRTAVHVEIPT